LVGWQVVTGLSYGYSKTKIGYLDNVNNDENAAHLKLKLKKELFSNYFKLSFGGVITSLNLTKLHEFRVTTKSNGYNSNIRQLTAKPIFYFLKKLAKSRFTSFLQ
jgi:hypothetical protein